MVELARNPGMDIPQSNLETENGLFGVVFEESLDNFENELWLAIAMVGPLAEVKILVSLYPTQLTRCSGYFSLLWDIFPTVK